MSNFSRKTNESLWLIESNSFIRSANTTHVFISCSFVICNKERRENETLGQPVLGEAPNCKGVPILSRTNYKREVITKDIILDITSKRLIPLQLLGLAKYPFFGRILKLPICYSGTLRSPLKYSEQISNKYFLFLTSKAFMAFGEMPFIPGTLCWINFPMEISSSSKVRGSFTSIWDILYGNSSITLQSI